MKFIIKHLLRGDLRPLQQGDLPLQLIPDGLRQRRAAARAPVAKILERLALRNGAVVDVDADALEDRVEALEATHATKEDGSFKTVAEEVNEAVVDLVDGAPEALDTLKEIADWIANQDESGVTDAATLLARVEANTQAIADEAERAEGAESDLQDAIDAVEEKVDAFARITESEIDKLFGEVEEEADENA